MSAYRLVIRRHGKLLGHFESQTAWAQEALQDVARQLPEDLGYQLETQVSIGERRLLESTPTGIRVLGSEQLFKTVTLGG